MSFYDQIGELIIVRNPWVIFFVYGFEKLGANKLNRALFLFFFLFFFPSLGSENVAAVLSNPKRRVPPSLRDSGTSHVSSFSDS